MSRKLAAYVHVHRSPTETVVYGPDDDVPAADAKLITNPACWADDGDDESPAPVKRAPRK